jgi:hypothetical protein
MEIEVKVYKEKLNLPPTHPEVTARVVEMIRSMTPDEALAFLEYRSPGVKEYWLGKPIRKSRSKAPSTTKNGAKAKP